MAPFTYTSGAIQDAVDRRFNRRRYDAVHRVRRHVTVPDPATTVDQVLRDAVGDPTLTVAYWVAQRQQWVTGDGHPTVPAKDALPVERAGRPVARISYDRAQEKLVRLVVGEAGPELDNAGLPAAVALQLEMVRASRTRIATAQVEERRRIERGPPPVAGLRRKASDSARARSSETRLRCGPVASVRGLRLSVPRSARTSRICR